MLGQDGCIKGVHQRAATLQFDLTAQDYLSNLSNTLTFNTMFSRPIAVFYFVLTAALLVAAMPASGAPAAAGTTVPTVSTEVFATRGDTCSTGPVQCCQTVGSVSALSARNA